MTIDLARIKEAAEKATKGGWFVLDDPWLGGGVETMVLAGSPDPHLGRAVCDFIDAATSGYEDEFTDEQWTARNWANAAHISASDPETVLTLVAVVEAALTHISEYDNPAPDLVMRASTRFILREALQPFTNGGGE